MNLNVVFKKKKKKSNFYAGASTTSQNLKNYFNSHIRRKTFARVSGYFHWEPHSINWDKVYWLFWRVTKTKRMMKVDYSVITADIFFRIIQATVSIYFSIRFLYKDRQKGTKSAKSLNRTLLFPQTFTWWTLEKSDSNITFPLSRDVVTVIIPMSS